MLLRQLPSPVSVDIGLSNRNVTALLGPSAGDLI